MRTIDCDRTFGEVDRELFCGSSNIVRLCCFEGDLEEKARHAGHTATCDVETAHLGELWSSMISTIRMTFLGFLTS